MIFTKDCGKIPVWLFTVPCEESRDDGGEGEDAGEQQRLFAPAWLFLTPSKVRARARGAKWLSHMIFCEAEQKNFWGFGSAGVTFTFLTLEPTFAPRTGGGPRSYI